MKKVCNDINFSLLLISSYKRMEGREYDEKGQDIVCSVIIVDAFWL